MKNHYNYFDEPISQESLIEELKNIKRHINNYINSFCREYKLPKESSKDLESQIFLVFDSAIRMTDNTIDIKKLKI